MVWSMKFKVSYMIRKITTFFLATTHAFLQTLAEGRGAAMLAIWIC